MPTLDQFPEAGTVLGLTSPLQPFPVLERCYSAFVSASQKKPVQLLL